MRRGGPLAGTNGASKPTRSGPAARGVPTHGHGVQHDISAGAAMRARASRLLARASLSRSNLRLFRRRHLRPRRLFAARDGHRFLRSGVAAPRVHQRARLQLEFASERRRARAPRPPLAGVPAAVDAGDAVVRPLPLPRRLRRQRAVLAGRADGTFDTIAHADMQCRTLTPDDVGRDIFGVAIAHALAMRLVPTWQVRLRQLVEPGLAFLAVAAALALLVRVRGRRVVLPFALIAVTLLVAMFNDASFLGGMRPFDSGDDGLVYDGYARMMLRQLVAGDVAGALEGVEPVFYFTPGLRYLRAAEHLIFGESYLGYLSLILLLPFLVFALFRRFLPLTWALALTLVFAAVPVGVLFGSSLVQYIKWAARGF